MDLKNLCFYLAQKDGTSGAEKNAAEAAALCLSEYMKVKIDKLGNVIGTMGDGKLHILLDAHLDQIGLVVREIDEKGFLLVDKVGGTDLRVLTGAEVTVHGKEKLYGVICSVPPHLSKNGDDSKKLDIRQMAVDIGFNKEDACNLVSIGDRITLLSAQQDLLSKNISSGAFDDRCAVAAIIRALELTKNKISNLKVSVMFSSQEETGGSGAKTGAFSKMPDYALVVDVGFGDDPYTDSKDTIALKKGPSIGIAPILDRNFTTELVKLAKDNSIPYQHDVMGRTTGTNADGITITGKGVKTALLSIPLRYMHTANEIINIDDVENTAKLIAAYLIKKEAEANA